MAFVERRASTPRRRYKLAEEHVAKRRNKQLTRLFRTTVYVPPDEREGDAEQEERDRELATSFQGLNTNIKDDEPAKRDKVEKEVNLRDLSVLETLVLSNTHQSASQT